MSVPPSAVEPTPAQKTIADVITAAPAFVETGGEPEAVAIDDVPAAKRGRGRPKKAGGREPSGSAPEAGGAPPLGEGGAVWAAGFEMRASGLWHVPKADDAQWLCGPFVVAGMVRTAEAQGWALYIIFKDPDGNEQTIIVPLSELAGDGVAVRRAFADRGLAISGRRGARERLSEALAGVRNSRRLLLVDRTGWVTDAKAFVLPHRTISGAGVEPIVFEGRARGAHFAESGDLAAWRELVAALAEGQDRLLLGLGVSFSGPLFELLGVSGGGFHLVGGSSCGKTTALLMAGSVWGGGGSQGYCQSWRATDNGLEGVASVHNGALLGLDEIGLIDPRALAAAAYALSGGEGKSRLRADAGLRERARWRIAILSTGEMGLSARIAEGGPSNRARVGQGVRIIDIAADAGRGFGLFDHLGGFADARELADKIRDESKKTYGTAGPAFVQILLDTREQSLATARTLVKEFIAEYVPASAGGQVARVGERFALAAAAGEIAIGMGILPFEQDAVFDACGRLFQGWIAARGGLGASENREAVDAMRRFIQAHHKARFIRLGTEDSESHSYRVQNAAGYVNAMRSAFYITEAGWAEAMAAFDKRAAADALSAAGFLLRDGSRAKRAEKVGSRTHRVYVIDEKIIEGDADD